MARILSYILLIIGTVLILLNTGVVQKAIAIPEDISSKLSGVPILILAIALVVAGIVLSRMGGRSRQKKGEVPIYKGKEVIGYRRN